MFFYLEAEGFGSEVAPLMVDQAKLKLQRMVPISGHLQLGFRNVGDSEEDQGREKREETDRTLVRNKWKE